MRGISFCFVKTYQRHGLGCFIHSQGTCNIFIRRGGFKTLGVKTVSWLCVVIPAFSIFWKKGLIENAIRKSTLFKFRIKNWFEAGWSFSSSKLVEFKFTKKRFNTSSNFQKHYKDWKAVLFRLLYLLVRIKLPPGRLHFQKHPDSYSCCTPIFY